MKIPQSTVARWSLIAAFVMLAFVIGLGVMNLVADREMAQVQDDLPNYDRELYLGRSDR